MINLIAITSTDVFTFLGGGTVVGGIVLYLIKWGRFAPMDKASREKVRAESKKIQVDADVAVGDFALKMAKDIREEANKAKEQLTLTQGELAKTAEMCRACTFQMEKMKIDLENEQVKNKAMTAKIDELVARITELLDEIAKLKKE